MATSGPPKITVYVPCRNYGRFLDDALASVIAQTLPDWELIIIDDGSDDETAAVAARYAMAQPNRVRVIRHESSRGLEVCSNVAFEQARGQYIIRLDADDYLDESALMVLSAYLDDHPDVALVFPNYIYVDENRAILGVENRRKIDDEVELLDLPAHGACTMVRRRVVKSVGGYQEGHGAQDGYQLWLKTLSRYKGRVANITTPLFYYRQHGASLSVDRSRLLAARQSIKRNLRERSDGPVKPRVVGIIGAKNTYEAMPNIVLKPLAGRPLLDYSLAAVEASGVFSHVLVTTDDPAVVDYCASFPGIVAAIRPPELSLPHVRVSEVLFHAVQQMERDLDMYPDIVVMLSVFTPLRRAEHIREAIDTLMAYDCDSIVSVYEDRELHFLHGRRGLEPFNRGMIRKLQLEREALYVDNQAIHALWRDAVTEQDLYGRSVGHIVMSWEESLQARSALEAELVATIIQNRRA